tara:strand:+ start:32896 stop:34173 length:1278 start_codon:yes stop_codon:yes gene_type:complete
MAGTKVSQSINYTDAKELARSKDVSVRAALAEREDLAGELLYFLAEDDDPEVRRAVAANAAAPRQTDLLLAQDQNEIVRGGLAAKIASLAPGLSSDESNKIRAQTFEALATLARDQITQVRALLSEALKDVVDAPSDVIKLLANDIEIAVSGPVLEFSPVLSDADLVEIIEKGPALGGIAAIARRQEVSENLADAIIDSDDVEGIADLLGNTSAQMREEALDGLVDRSRDIELWQAPLVARSVLPNGAAERMAGFLASNLLDALRERGDLDRKTLDAVCDIVQNRIGGRGAPIKKAVAPGFDFLKVDPPLEIATRLMEADRLKTDVILKALRAGDHAFVFAAIIVLAGVDLHVARKIFIEKSPAGIVALIGKAKLPAKMIVTTQQKMGRIAPTEIIHPNKEDEFPMSDKDIEWQIEFYADMAERA